MYKKLEKGTPVSFIGTYINDNGDKVYEDTIGEIDDFVFDDIVDVTLYRVKYKNPEKFGRAYTFRYIHDLKILTEELADA